MNYSNYTYEKVIATLCGEMGYKPYLENLNSTEYQLTAARMAIVKPSTVVGLEGNNRCRLTSEIDFILMRNATGVADSQRSEIWNGVKCDAVNIMCELKNHLSILDVSDVEITPIKSVKGRGNEIAVLVEATIISSLDIEDNLSQII